MEFSGEIVIRVPELCGELRNCQLLCYVSLYILAAAANFAAYAGNCPGFAHPVAEIGVKGLCHSYGLSPFPIPIRK